MNQGQNIQLRQIGLYMSQQFCGRQENTLGEHELRKNGLPIKKGLIECFHELAGHVY
jgi:hypothetical protein